MSSEEEFSQEELAMVRQMGMPPNVGLGFLAARKGIDVREMIEREQRIKDSSADLSDLADDLADGVRKMTGEQADV